MDMKLAIYLVALVGFFVCLIRMFIIGRKHRVELKKRFQVIYGYELKSPFDFNYIKFSFGKDELMKKVRWEYYINLLLFFIFAVIAGMFSS